MPEAVVYLDEEGRKAFKITFQGTRIVFSEQAKDSGMDLYDGEIIFVVDGKNFFRNNFYFGVKDVGRFHHSSMLSGAPVSGAGTMKINISSKTKTPKKYTPILKQVPSNSSPKLG